MSAGQLLRLGSQLETGGTQPSDGNPRVTSCSAVPSARALTKGNFTVYCSA